MRRIIVGISGSSSPIYGIRTLVALAATPDVETHLILSDGARVTIKHEAPEWSIDDIIALADVSHDPHNMAAAISSGSFKTDGMVVVPCSMKTLSAIAHPYSTDLLTRAAEQIERPVLLINQSEDLLFSREAAFRLYDALSGPKRIFFHPGGHSAVPREAMERVREFLHGHLASEGGDSGAPRGSW